MEIHSGITASTYRKMKKFALYFLGFVAILSCNNDVTLGCRYAAKAPIYPDYMDVTIPVGIAPLNFDYIEPCEECVTKFSAGNIEYVFEGTSVRWKTSQWNSLVEAAKGGEIKVYSSAPDTSWTIKVSDDAIDYGLAYRLLEPGYEVYSKMGIYERELSSFKQKALIENTEFDGCVNCHSFNRTSPEDFSLHIRGDHGATILRSRGEMDAYNTKTDSTLGFCVYPAWHPSGKYIAYSTNATRQLFHVHPDKLIEVFDMDSDMLVYDIDGNEIVVSPDVCQEDYWETFPSFSADGSTLYFCRAVAVKEIPDSLHTVRYNLCKVNFNAETGAYEGPVETVVDAASAGKSVSFPKASYDGRFIAYTLSDYGQFSIWHHEADLWLLDLATGESRPMQELNSPDVESYHSWSSNSRWLVFSSRRDDGLFTRLYISHIAQDGSVGKPFMLPQKEPLKFYTDLFMSYNVPEFVSGPVTLQTNRAVKMIDSPERKQMGIR